MSRDTDVAPAARWKRWKYWLPAVVVIPLAFAGTPWLIGPSCPKAFVIVAGPKDGAYYAFAQRYAKILERDGVTLKVRETAGSIENRELLSGDDDTVLIGILQGGTANDATREQTVALGSLYHEPVWVFHRKSLKLARLNQLDGKRVAVGPVGSGTRAVAKVLLQDNGIELKKSPQTLPLGGRDAAKALKENKVDAAFFVISPKAEVIRELLAAPEIELFHFRRADAYCRRHRFLSSVTLAEGAIDLDRNLPHRKTVLLAPTANLVARNDLHPALIPLLMKATREVHEEGGLLDDPGTFPSARHTDIPMHHGAKSYLTSGPTFLYRTLPFEWAVRIDRLKLMILPLLTLLIPLFKLTPPLWRWRIRRRFYRMYAALREIDESARDASPDTRRKLLAQLREVDAQIAELSIPKAYMSEYYELQLHAAHLTDRVSQMQQRSPTHRAAA